MTLLTAFAFPALGGSVFLLEGFQQWLVGSTGAVPFRILLLLLAMLLFVQTPLVFLGSFYGFKKEHSPQVRIFSCLSCYFSASAVFFRDLVFVLFLCPLLLLVCRASATVAVPQFCLL